MDADQRQGTADRVLGERAGEALKLCHLLRATGQDELFRVKLTAAAVASLFILGNKERTSNKCVQ